MYCRNCGAEMSENAEFCTGCGFLKGNGNSFCPYCGEAVAFKDADVCVKCGYRLKSGKRPAYGGETKGKSKLAAGLLQIFFGGLGIGRFYLGYTSIGVWQIVVNVCTCGIGGSIWGVIDGILILSGQVTEDADGNPLAD